MQLAHARRAVLQPLRMRPIGQVTGGGCSLPCLLVLVPLYARAGDRVFVAICLAQVAVLLFAASGVLNTGH